MIILYNPRIFNGFPSSVIRDMWQGKAVVIEPNTMKKFGDENLGHYLLKKYGFLKEVEVDQVIKIQAEIDRPEAKDDKEEIKNRKLQNLTEKQLEALNSLPSGDAGEEVAVDIKSTKPLSPEESAGIPSKDGAKDADGVTWVGDGLQEDKPDSFMAPRRPGKTKGVFGAA